MAVASTAPATPFVADVPLVEANGMPCVDVTIGGDHKALFAIDSGDADSTVDLDDARAAGLELKSAGPTNPNVYTSKVLLVRIGALAMANVPALAFDFKANKMPPGITGTLAYTAFRDRIL
jgi:hypothetical protein